MYEERGYLLGKKNFKKIFIRCLEITFSYLPLQSQSKRYYCYRMILKGLVLCKSSKKATLAQLVEQLICNQ